MLINKFSQLNEVLYDQGISVLYDQGISMLELETPIISCHNINYKFAFDCADVITYCTLYPVTPIYLELYFCLVHLLAKIFRLILPCSLCLT